MGKTANDLETTETILEMVVHGAELVSINE